jgi:hypothetical protein
LEKILLSIPFISRGITDRQSPAYGIYDERALGEPINTKDELSTTKTPCINSLNLYWAGLLIFYNEETVASITCLLSPSAG